MRVTDPYYAIILYTVNLQILKKPSNLVACIYFQQF